MGNHLTRAMTVVGHDVLVMGAALPVVEDSNWQREPNTESAFLHNADGTGMGVWVDTTKSFAEQVAALADQVQDWVVELSDERVTNWPQCPDHPVNHPMVAVVVDGSAMWVCLKSKRPVSRVGMLASSAT